MGSDTDPQVAGKAFLGLIKQLRSAHGDAAVKQVVDAASPEVGAVFAQRIGSMLWYPYPAFSTFLVVADKTFGKGDLALCRTLGAGAGEEDLGTVFKLLRRLASPERLIRSCDRVWESYYRNAGRMIATEWRPESTVLRIEGFATMHPAHCRLMEGWMERTMQVIGVKIAAGSGESECTSRGGAHHEFRCEWRKA